jgi:hypothetical protein
VSYAFEEKAWKSMVKPDGLQRAVQYGAENMPFDAG